MNSNFLSDQLLAKLLEVVRWYDSIFGELPEELRSDPLDDNFVPFELLSAPEENDEGIQVAKGKQLYFDEEEGFRTDDNINDVESEIYFPLSETPDHAGGDRLFCIWRGRWEAVGSPGGRSKTYGIIMEPIGRTDDPTSNPADYTFGKVRVIGKPYSTKDSDGNDIEPEYDDCANLYLAETEVAVVGLQVELLGPFKRKNPDYVPPTPPGEETETGEEPTEETEGEGEEEPEFLEYYTVAEWAQEWYAEIPEAEEGAEEGAGNLYGQSSATVEISDIAGAEEDRETYEVTVWNDLFSEDYYFEAGTIIRFRGEAGPNGKRLVIVGDACPVLDFSEEEAEEGGEEEVTP